MKDLRVLGAGVNPLELAGTLMLPVRFGPYVVKCEFLVRVSLQVNYILGTEFIDRHVRNINAQDRFVEILCRNPNPTLFHK